MLTLRLATRADLPRLPAAHEGASTVSKSSERTEVVSLAEGLAKGPPPAGNLAIPVFAHGTLEVELYAPQGADPQQPHNRDEVYVVVRGSGVFFDGVARRAVGPGAFIFVAADQPHRFEDFTPDFAVWVFFYSPPGGESSA